MKNSEPRLSIRQKRICTVAGLFVLRVFTAWIGWFIGRPMVRFVSEPELFRNWVDSHGIWGRIAFVGMVIFQVVFAVIPGEPLEIGAGYAFGAIEGTFLCIVGLTVGGLIVFALVRTLGIRVVEVFFSIEKIRSLKFLQNSRRLNTVTFIVFFLPGTPKDLLSYFVGLTDIKVSVWIFITSVARLPSVVTSTLGGNALGDERYVSAMVVFAATLVVSGIGMLAYRVIARHHDKNK